MVIRPVLSVPGLLAALTAMGCFDVHSVETGPLVIDDFDDGDVYPPDPTFERWGCQKFSPPTKDGYQCNIEPLEYQRTPSLYLKATIDDVLDRLQAQGGAFLQTIASTPKDFGRFGRLVFAAKLDRAHLPPLSTPTFDVQFGCNTALLTAGPRPDFVYVGYRTEPLGADWQIVTVELNNLTEPPPPAQPDALARLMDRSPGCLKVVDTIRFVLSAGLPDGNSGEFTLHVDDIELE